MAAKLSPLITISLSAARRSLDSPESLRAMVDCLPRLSAESIEELGPLVFDVLALEEPFPVPALLKDMLGHRPEWLGQVNEHSYNLLMQAIALNRLDLVEVLMEAGADISHYHTDALGIAGVAGVLELAASKRSDHQTEEAFGNALLAKGNFSNTQKDMALSVAAYSGNLGMIRSLLAHGAGFGVTFNGCNALVHASTLIESRLPAVEIVRALLQAEGGKALIDNGWDTPGTPTPIHRAAFNGSLGVIGVLLEAGARLSPPEDLQSGNRETPLMAAAQGLKPEAIALLLKAGCDAKATDIRGRNALHHLANYRDWLEREPPLLLKAIDLLASAGADPFQTDANLCTPLDIAVLREEADIIEAFYLLEARTLSCQMADTTEHPVASRRAPTLRL